MLEKGSVVKSLAGRDKGKLLMVTDVSEKGIAVCDGRERPLNRPKLKNPRHIQDTGLRLDITGVTGDKALKKLLAGLSFNLEGLQNV
ncbi:MAG: KOW domain-containing RNA-binding protein [Oscillospiraceae bacterium]|nr:KOW domain-containing RNA-binding protein [Oscillospiraceae bacterium]